MGYALGLDLGTTFTAAAVHRNGRTDMVSLGNRSSAIPSLVFLRDDEEILVGDAAERRGVTDPRRLAREFKRRLGDSTPIMLGSSPYSAERIMAALMRDVVDTVAGREGGPPDAVVITHPANWGPFKTDLLRQAADLAGLRDATLMTEPVAAARHYASNERVEPGEAIAVYDLGGGTFDAAILRKTDDGFELLGAPEGIERLGGIDFDEAVFRHVRDALGPAFDALDQDDPTVRTAMLRLRQDCATAKEALSSDTDATVAVILPGLQSDIRITRDEFEAMIRPTLRETVDALRRAIASAQLQPTDLHAVLLVGGSSRIPLVAEMVSSELGRPVAVDAHPKHSVALGAALVASEKSALPGTPDAPATGVPTAAAGAAAAAAGAVAAQAPQIVTAEELAVSVPPPTSASAGGAAPPGTAGPTPAPVPAGSGATGGGRSGGSSNTRMIALALLAVVVAVGGVVAFLLLTGNKSSTASGSTSSTSTTTTTSSATSSTLPDCTSASGRCAFITDLRLDGDTYIATYTTVGFDPVMAGSTDHHVHFFFDTVTAANAGTNGHPPGKWIVWDRASGGGELVFNGFTLGNQAENDGAGATQMCIEVADHNHAIETGTGNCVALPTA